MPLKYKPLHEARANQEPQKSRHISLHMKHFDIIHSEFFKLAIPYPMGIHNLDKKNPIDKSRSKSLMSGDAGIDLTKSLMQSQDDMGAHRFRNFYDVSYGKHVYRNPDNEQLIMNMTNRLFDLGPNVDFDSGSIDEYGNDSDQQ